MDPVVQISELALELCFVGFARQPVHARRRVLLKCAERLAEVIDAYVVEQRGELLLLPFSRDFPYAFQRMPG